MAPRPRPESVPGLRDSSEATYCIPPENRLSPEEAPKSKEELQYDELQKKLQLEKEEFRAVLRMDKPILGIDQLHLARIFVVVNHVLGAYGLYLILTGHFSWKVLLFQLIYSYAGALGTTVGAHRLWTHKSFKAKLPLKILLMCMQTITVQYSIYKWCLDHRIHHKYADTDKDPHNIKRGFWFSQIFWTISKKHPDHVKELKSFDMPDLEKDPVVLFQSRYYPLLVFIFYSGIPVQAVWFATGFGHPRFHIDCLNCFRWVYNTHISSAVNSFAHLYGDKPFDKEITSSDNRIVSVFAVGEGWHNYHHTFPWDYKTSEFGWKINVSTMFIDFFAWVGWAYDLKTVSQEMLLEKVRKSGDGSHWSHHHHHHQENDQVDKESNHCGDAWGWGDETISDEFKKMTVTLKPIIACPKDR